MEANDAYLTISQAAEYCSMNRGTIQRWVSDRQLTRHKKETARSADIPVHMGEETLVRMNSYLMARHGKDVLELYDPVNTRVCVVRMKLEELS